MSDNLTTITPPPVVATEVKFTIDQHAIVDAFLTSQVTPLQSHIDGYNTQIEELSKRKIAINAELRGMAKALCAAGETLLAPVKAAIDSLVAAKHSKAVTYVTERIEQYVDEDDDDDDDGEGQTKVNDLVLDIRLMMYVYVVPKERNEHIQYVINNYSPQFSWAHSVTPTDEMLSKHREECMLIAELDKIYKNRNKLNNEIQRIYGTRQQLLAQVNTKLLLESTHGQAMIGLLTNAVPTKTIETLLS